MDGRPAIGIDEAGEPAIAHRKRRQGDVIDAGAGKALHRHPPGHQRDLHPARPDRSRDPAGACQMADAEKVLDVEEDPCHTHDLCPVGSSSRASWSMLVR